MNGQKSQIPEEMPSTLSKYYVSNDVNMFVYSKPFRKGEKSNNEFADLWIKNSYFQTEDSFPTIHRRSQIISTTSREISPIDNAFESIHSKNNELVELVTSHKVNPDEKLQNFSMVLKGITDAAVNGGTDRYKEAFFSEQYLKSNPDKAEVVSNLKKSIREQISILEEAIALHKLKCERDPTNASNLLLLHETIETKYEEMKSKAANL